jgi:hypothetical protein
MAKTPSPLHARRIPGSVSKPTLGAEAAAVAAEASVAPAAKRGASKAKTAAAAPVAAPAPQAAKPAKVHKPKLVRDSFTMPKDEYQVIDALKRRALGLEKHVRKSELLRAGIQALAAMSDRAFLKAVNEVPTLKTGRPKAD